MEDVQSGYYEYGYMFYASGYNDATLKTHLPVYMKDRPDISLKHYWEYCTNVYYDGNPGGQNRYSCNELTVNNRAIVIDNLNYDIIAGSIDNPFGESSNLPRGVEREVSLGVSGYSGYNKITRVAVVTDYDGDRGRSACSYTNPICSPDIRNVKVNTVGKVTIKDTRPYDAHQSYTSGLSQ